MANIPESSDDAPLELRAWADWPSCPACGQRRQARCSTCGLAGDSFPLADYQELGVEPVTRAPPGESTPASPNERARVLLMCPVCEEAFRPNFYHRCAACGYDFGAGVRLDAAGDEPLPARVVWTMIAVILSMFAVLAYLWLIVQN